MDDLLGMLSDFLSTDEGRQQLKAIASVFSKDEGSAGEAPAGAEAPDETSSASANAKPAENTDEHTAAAGLAQNGLEGLLPKGLDMSMLMKLAPVISKLSEKSDDKNSRLIMALKPHLKPENRHRADEAAHILKLISILPTLKDIDLF